MKIPFLIFCCILFSFQISWGQGNKYVGHYFCNFNINYFEGENIQLFPDSTFKYYHRGMCYDYTTHGTYKAKNDTLFFKHLPDTIFSTVQKITTKRDSGELFLRHTENVLIKTITPFHGPLKLFYKKKRLCRISEDGEINYLALSSASRKPRKYYLEKRKNNF